LNNLEVHDVDDEPSLDEKGNEIQLRVAEK
jgi:hypothetical protein